MNSEDYTQAGDIAAIKEIVQRHGGTVLGSDVDEVAYLPEFFNLGWTIVTVHEIGLGGVKLLTIVRDEEADENTLGFEDCPEGFLSHLLYALEEYDEQSHND
jgi:hypothetical protein